MTDNLLNAEQLRVWMVDYISAVLDLGKEKIGTDAPFDSYGLDSAEAVIMAGVMEEEFHREIDPNMFFDDPSIDGVVRSFQAAGLAT